jgi:hypothetical protein
MEITKKLFRTSVIAIVLIFGEAAFSQEYPWSIYPLELGNIWVTRDGFGKAYERIEIIDTGIIIDDNSYFKSKHISYQTGGTFYEGHFYHRTNNGNYIVWYDSTGTYINPDVKYYKITAQPGQYWQNVIGPPGDGTRHYFVVDTSYYLVFGTSTKVREIFVTDSSLYENYTFWSEEFGLLEHYVHDFELGNYIYLRGCVINGVLYGDTTFLTVGVDGIQTTPVTEYKLYQNFPNPFNPSTSISYYLPQRSYVKLKVCDVLGKEIIVLINEEKEADHHQANFDASNLPSGVYIYTLKVNGFTDSKKMLILR